MTKIDAHIDVEEVEYLLSNYELVEHLTGIMTGFLKNLITGCLA